MSARRLATTRARRATALARAGVAGLVGRNAARHVAHSLGELRGLPQKLGQMLAGADGAEPVLAGLYDAAEPLPLEALLPALERALGVPWRSVFRGIEARGLAASLGQVHRATLRDGREAALKLRYPGIVAAVEADLGLLGWLSVPFGGLARGFDLEGYRAEIGGMLARELDYRVEAAEQRAYRALALGSGVCVPEVLPVVTSEDVLVSAWEPGTPVDEAARWARAERRAAAEAFLAHALELLLVHGIVHADPHPGNLRWRASGAERAVLYDHGCVLRLEAHEHAALLGLLECAIERTEALPWLVALGFDAARLAPLAGRLASLVGVVLEPFLAREPWDPRGWDLARRTAALLGEERWNFRMAGPPRLIYLLRAVRGWVAQLERLDVPLVWRERVEDGLRRARVARAAPAVELRAGASLEIRVEREGVERVRLNMPASALERLDELLDGDLNARIASQGVVLDQVVARARASGYAPQELFTLSDAGRRVTVRLS